MAVAVVAVVVAAVGHVRNNSHAVAAQAAASRVEAANIDLQDDLSRLRDKMAANSRDLAAAQGRVAALVEETRARPQPAPVAAAEPAAPAKSDNKVTQLSSALHVAEAQRATLAARLSKAEAELAGQQAKQTELSGELDQWQKKFQQLTADRDRLKNRVGELEKQSALRHQAQQLAEARVPAAAPAPAPAQAAEAPQRVAGVLNAPVPVAAPAPAAAQAPVSVPAVAQAPAAAPAPVAAQGPAVGNSAVDHFARVLASAGVDVRHLFAELGSTRARAAPLSRSAGGSPWIGR